MKEGGQTDSRFPIQHWDGINSTVQPNLAKRTELSHAENARSPLIGVLEKREGYTSKGTAVSGGRFFATENFGLVVFPTTNSSQQGVFRISASSEPSVTLTASVSDVILINEAALKGSFSSPDYSIFESTTDFQVFVIDTITLTEPSFSTSLDSVTTRVTNAVPSASVYSLSTQDTWTLLSDADAQGITGGTFDTTIAEGDLYMVNFNDQNRRLASNGITMITSSDVGSLYNSPNASKITYYKGRLHLADYLHNGVRYPTTVLRSSRQMGIIALVDGDHDAGAVEIQVTDAKYFYANSGMNTYDIYRGTTKIETITVSGVNETSITVNATSNGLNSADEVWIAGTYNGGKQFRWINNPTSHGRDMKQYDTFKLSGGDESPITLFETVGNVLMIGNKRSLGTWDDYNLNLMDNNIGCSSSNGSTKMLGTLYFIDYTGIYATTGGSPTLISRKVDRYIAGATKGGLESAAAGYKGLSVFFAIGDVTLYNEDGSFWKVLPDVCLEFSVSDQNWYVHTNVPVSSFANFIAASGTRYLLAAHTGNSKTVMSFLDGNTDDGNEIFFRVDTQEIQPLSEFETNVKPLAIVTEVTRGSQLRCYISLNRGQFYELPGSVSKGVSTVKVASVDTGHSEPPLCRKLTISYRDGSKQLCRINQMAIIYTPTLIDEPVQ